MLSGRSCGPSVEWRVAPTAENRSSCQIRLGQFSNEYKAKSVELIGFEPTTPSLRKMRSKRSDQGFWTHSGSLWRACGTSEVRPGETA